MFRSSTDEPIIKRTVITTQLRWSWRILKPNVRTVLTTAQKKDLIITMKAIRRLKERKGISAATGNAVGLTIFFLQNPIFNCERCAHGSSVGTRFPLVPTPLRWDRRVLPIGRDFPRSRCQRDNSWLLLSSPRRRSCDRERARRDCKRSPSRAPARNFDRFGFAHLPCFPEHELEFLDLHIYDCGPSEVPTERARRHLQGQFHCGRILSTSDRFYFLPQ